MHVNIGLCSLVITGLNHVNRNSYQVEVHSIPDILKESNDCLRSMHILAETQDTPALNFTEFCSVVLGTEVSIEIFFRTYGTLLTHYCTMHTISMFPDIKSTTFENILLECLSAFNRRVVPYVNTFDYEVGFYCSKSFF